MANLPWFKFYAGDYLTDPKIMLLSGNERSCWITIMCQACQNDGKPFKFFSEKQLLVMSGIMEDIEVFKKFEELDMIRISNGFVTVLNWEKRQYSEGYSRVKEFRKRKSNTEDNNRVDKSREEEIRIEKSIYGEFKNVLLTPEEYEKLISKLGDKNTHILIEELSGYLASKKVKYASHYATLLNWARRKIVEHINKPTKGKQIIGL